MMGWRGVVEEYRDLLPVEGAREVVTLLEGNTPLIPSRRRGLYLKYEGANPTGSFKDRGMALAMTMALSRGARAVVCASTGNTSASAAAYAARAGLGCLVIVPAGQVAAGKLAQARAYGAQVLESEGGFDDAQALVRELAAREPRLELVNSLNPYRTPGQMTAAFEICDVLGRAPDLVILPVGNAANIVAYWRGFVRYSQHRRITTLPRMIGVQARGAAPLVLGRPVRPETAATAIRIGRPVNADKALAAVRESGGAVIAVEEWEIEEAARQLAREGVFAEPASAASVAGYTRLLEAGYVRAKDLVVCVLTGNGLKDPDYAIRYGSEVRAFDGGPEALLAEVRGWLDGSV